MGPATRWFWGMAAWLLLTLVVGLWPFNICIENHVRWSDDGTALQFRRYGVAYTDILDEQRLESMVSAGVLAIEADLEPEPGGVRGHRAFIVACSRIGRRYNFALAQDGHRLLFYLKTDPPPAVTDQPVIEVPRVCFPHRRTRVAVEVRRGLARIWINGELRATQPVPGSLSAWYSPARLYLGNEASGRHPWQGRLYDVSVSGGDPKSGGAVGITLFKGVNATPGTRSTDPGVAGSALTIPRRFVLPSRRWLAWPGSIFVRSGPGRRDGLINLAGFVPLGFLMTRWLRSRGATRKRACGWSVWAGVACSLGIEIVQGWLPGRDSSVLDLGGNAIGACIGACLAGMPIECAQGWANTRAGRCRSLKSRRS